MTFYEKKHSISISVFYFIFLLPEKLSLLNYPNPFNSSTVIRFGLPPSADNRETVTLIIYDMLGREAVVLVNEKLGSGDFEINFDASNLTTGIYYSLLVC